MYYIHIYKTYESVIVLLSIGGGLTGIVAGSGVVPTGNHSEVVVLFFVVVILALMLQVRQAKLKIKEIKLYFIILILNIKNNKICVFKIYNDNDLFRKNLKFKNTSN